MYTSCIHASCRLATLFVRDEDAKEEVFRKGSRLWGSLLTDAALLNIKVSGLENIPEDTNVIFTPNHQSYLDVFIMLKYLRTPFRFVIMRDLFKVPVLGPHITRSGFLSLDRKDRKGAIKTIHLIIEMLRKGESFLIFPEGMLTQDGNVGAFGRGTSMIIQRSGKPVVPISIDGTFNVLPKGAWSLSRGEVKIKIGKPIRFGEHHGEISKESSIKIGDELRDIVVDLKG